MKEIRKERRYKYEGRNNRVEDRKERKRKRRNVENEIWLWRKEGNV